MSKLVRVVELKHGAYHGVRYMYACDICGAEVPYYTKRSTQVVCRKCRKEKNDRRLADKRMDEDTQLLVGFAKWILPNKSESEIISAIEAYRKETDADN